MVLLRVSDAGPRLAATLPEIAAIDEGLITLTDLRTLANTAAVSPSISVRWRRGAV